MKRQDYDGEYGDEGESLTVFAYNFSASTGENEITDSVLSVRSCCHLANKLEQAYTGSSGNNARRATTMTESLIRLVKGLVINKIPAYPGSPERDKRDCLPQARATSRSSYTDYLPVPGRTPTGLTPGVDRENYLLIFIRVK